MKLAESRLGFLRVITPREPGQSSGNPLDSGRFVMNKAGELEKGAVSLPDKALGNGGVDPDDLARHNYLLERQHFMHR
jgi:hypothetical protein